jgi:histidine triad (HIT) family protein
MENCIFCKIKKGQIPSHKIWEDEKHYAFLDINPISPGHMLLIPKNHQDYLFDMEEGHYSELLLVARTLAKKLQKAMNAKRIGVAVEGFDVPHVHIHLIPLNHGGEFNTEKAKPVGKEQLSEIAEKVKSSF